MLGRIETPANGYMPAFASLQVVRAARMVVPTMPKCPQNGVSVGNVCQPGQVLTNAQPGSAAGYGLVGPPNIVWCRRLQIEGFKLTGAAKQKQENDIFGFGRLGGRRGT